MKMKNNIDIIDNRRNKPENKKSIILIICGIALILVATVISLISSIVIRSAVNKLEPLDCLR